MRCVCRIPSLEKVMGLNPFVIGEILLGNYLDSSIQQLIIFAGKKRLKGI